MAQKPKKPIDNGDRAATREEVLESNLNNMQRDLDATRKDLDLNISRADDAEAYGYLIQGQLNLAQEALAKMSAIIEPLPAHDVKVRSCFTFANDARERQKLLAISS